MIETSLLVGAGADGGPISADQYKKAIYRPPPDRFYVEMIPPVKQGGSFSYGMRISAITRGGWSPRGAHAEYEVWRRWEDCLWFQEMIELEYSRMARSKRSRLVKGRGVKKNGIYIHDQAASFESLPPGPDPDSVARDIHDFVPRLTKRGTVFRASQATIDQRSRELTAFINGLFKEDAPSLVAELREQRLVTDFFGYWRRDYDLALKQNHAAAEKQPRNSVTSSVFSAYFSASSPALDSFGPLARRPSTSSSAASAVSSTLRPSTASSTLRPSTASSTVRPSTASSASSAASSTARPSPLGARPDPRPRSDSYSGSRASSSRASFSSRSSGSTSEDDGGFRRPPGSIVVTRARPPPSPTTPRERRSPSPSPSASASSTGSPCPSSPSSPVSVYHDVPIFGHKPDYPGLESLPEDREMTGSSGSAACPSQSPKAGLHLRTRRTSAGGGGGSAKDNRNCQIFYNPPQSVGGECGGGPPSPLSSSNRLVRESWQTTTSVSSYLDCLDIKYRAPSEHSRFSVASFMTAASADAVIPRPGSASDAASQCSRARSTASSRSARSGRRTAVLSDDGGYDEEGDMIDAYFYDPYGDGSSSPHPDDSRPVTALGHLSISSKASSDHAHAHAHAGATLFRPHSRSSVTTATSRSSDSPSVAAAGGAVVSIKAVHNNAIVILRVPRHAPFADVRKRLYDKFVGQEGVPLSQAFAVAYVLPDASGGGGSMAMADRAHLRFIACEKEWEQVVVLNSAAKLTLRILDSAPA